MFVDKDTFEGFYKIFTYLVSINKRTMITTEGACANFVKNSLLSCISLLVKGVE